MLTRQQMKKVYLLEKGIREHKAESVLAPARLLGRATDDSRKYKCQKCGLLFSVCENGVCYPDCGGKLIRRKPRRIAARPNVES
jgi:hypothetical protein